MKLRPPLRQVVPLVLPAVYLVGLQQRNDLLLLVPACVLFLLTPLLDAALPRDRSKGNAFGPSPIALPTLYVLLHAASLIATAGLVANSAGLMTATVCVASLGAIGAVSITASHELLHGRSRWGRRTGRFGMLMVAYGHFEIAHLHGHHRNAATLTDHSTAWHGESLYHYLVRTVPTCFGFARAEARRRGWRWSTHRPLSPGRSLLLAAGIALALVGLGGVPMLAIHAGHAVLAVGLLEATSYIQHYGLLRPPGEPGSHFAAAHAWDSDHAMSNALLFRLPRHADHHLVPGRGYGQLALQDGARPLPAGYPSMILLALLPPLWRRVMDPLLARAAKHGD